MNEMEHVLRECEALATAFCDNELSDRMYSQKLAAVQRAIALSDQYRRNGFHDALIDRIFDQRINMIRKATTAVQLEMISKPKPPYYNGVRFQPANEFSIPEEELLLWSMTSLKGPLIREGYERFEELFRKVYGALPDEPGFMEVE